MLEKLLMSEAFRLMRPYLLTLFGFVAVWGVFAWVTPAPDNNYAALSFAEAKPLSTDNIVLKNYGPFSQENPAAKNDNFRLLSQGQSAPSLMQGLQALYLSDFSSDEEALAAWENYKSVLPILHLFQPFAVPKSGNDNGISLMAMIQQAALPPGAAHDIVIDTCDNIRIQGQSCMPVSFNMNIQGLNATLEAVPTPYTPPPVYLSHGDHDHPDPVMQQHMRKRAQVNPFDHKNYETAFNEITPAAGHNMAQSADEIINNTDVMQPVSLAQNSGNDTVAQAAARAAYDMVRNRYADAIYQAQLNDGDAPNFSKQDAVALSQGALTSAAERAFETFIQKNFGKRDFSGQNYDGLRGYFMTAFQHAASTSIKSVGRRFVNDLTSGGDFKSLEIRSELLKGLEADVASAFIDTGLAAARNAQYAFLRNLEVTYRIREKNKPEYSLLTLQPLYSSKDRKHNLYGQAAYSNLGSRNSFTGGVGYRYMPDSKNYVVGSNIFVDYERTYGHLRSSLGLDYQTSLWGASANYYKGLTDWRDAQTGFQEQALDGYDVELAGRMPFLPALEVFGRGYRWQGVDGADDINGHEMRVEYSPVPAFTVEGLYNDEDGRESQFGLGIRYNHRFGAPREYQFDWEEQFRQKSAAEYIFRKARRENEIRVQTRIDPDAPTAVIIGPALVATAPLNAATGVSIGTDVTLTFADDVLAGTGNIVFTDLTDGSDDFTIPVGDARVSIVNNVVTVDLSAQLLEFSSNYEVSFAEGVFTDTSGNDSPALAPGDYSFTTVVDPTAGFPVATATLPPNSSGAAFNPRNTTSSWQTTMNITGAPNGVIFESGATGRGIAAWFHLGNLRFAAGQGNVTTTGGGAIFGDFPTASIPLGLHHFVFVAKPSAAGEIGVYMDGIRVITETTAAAMASGEWAGTDGSGYGQSNGNVRDGGNNAAITNVTLTNNLSFFLSQQPASF